MAQSKALILVTIALLSSKVASSFPAEHESDSRIPAADYGRTEQNVYYEEAYDDDLLSVLPCKGASIPQPNFTRSHSTTIEYDSSSYGWICKATPEYDDPFANPVSNTQTIQSPNFPVADSYPSNRLYISNFGCPQGQEPVIEAIDVLLQQPMVYRKHNYCVDYVKIDPPINNGNAYFCGNQTYGGPFRFGGAQNVQVTFRTSHKNNAHKGFCVWLHCESSLTAEENALLQHLQLLSKSPINQQRLNENADDRDSVQFESLAKLVNFASYHCKSAYALEASPYWNIVKLALRYEKVDDEQVQKIAQDVLQCFPPSQINVARIEMEEGK